MFRSRLLIAASAAAILLVSAACSGTAEDATPTASPSAPTTATAATATEVPAATATPAVSVAAAEGPRDASYTIEGVTVQLVDGVAEVEAASGSASRTTTRYFGNEVTGDFDGDGRDDIAFLLTQDGGGSGTFFYVVVALDTADGYIGTNAVLLGDRIAPQTTEYRDGQLIVNFTDRAPGEPMTAQPSVGVSIYLAVDGGVLAKQ